MSKKTGRRSIFRSLFVPMIIIMILQAVIFYVAAVYGGIEESLSRNAADILNERLYNRKNEVETRFNNRWTQLDGCVTELESLYEGYEKKYGSSPLTGSAQLQKDFLGDSGELLIDALRYSEANGIFLIINDKTEKQTEYSPAGEQKYGLCIRDMNQESNYSGTGDLVLERAPSSIIDSLGCSLDSWWEAKYSFTGEGDGDYYYLPLNAAFDDPDADSGDLAYLSGVHQISGSDPKIVSYSIPLMADDGYPYAVLGVELSVKYLASLLPNKELNDADKCSYVLALGGEGSDSYTPLVGTGSLFSRCFGSDAAITGGRDFSTGGFAVTGRDGTELYTQAAELEVYNNNNPFESRSLILLAMVETQTLFSYIGRIKNTLLLVSILSLLLGVSCLAVVSRRFASPITALARRVKDADENKTGYELDRLGITEIDQLVDAIEELNRNVSRNSARTEFFSRMSHDMRTPMNAIISFSSPEMLENADDALKDDYLDKIHSSGTYLLGLINEVLDMTKIESHKTELHPAAVRGAELFESTIPIIEKLAQKKNIDFITEIRTEPKLWVMADRQHLCQIVMNLLSNAVKFTPDGGRVSLTVALENSGRLNVEVIDTGIGMSREFMKNLYTPFEQENGTHEGTGLGLSIAKKLAELMGGTIDCESVQGKGTTFKVAVPLEVTDAPLVEINENTLEISDDITRLKGRRVLVCEDNMINVRIIRHLLERVGLTIDVAENGELGVEMFRDSKPMTYCAILMDIRMPVMDGLEATKAIRALARPDANEIPIIAMTADAFEEDAKGSIAAGMNEHLSKPVETPKLYGALLRFIK